jgi:hypothetical protein
MAQPGILSSQIPPGEDHVMRALADIRREMRELGPSIMHSIQGIVDELVAHQATLDAQQATLTAQQATLTTTVADLATAQATLATTVSGLSAAVADIATNLASLNAVIGQQVAATAVHADSGSTAFAVTTTTTTQASVTVTVPTGYTQALILAEGQASAINNTGGVDTINVDAAVNGVVVGWSAAQDIAPGGLGGATKAAAKRLTGLTGGGTFTLSTRISSNYANWTGTTANSCNIDATVVFLR